MMRLIRARGNNVNTTEWAITATDLQTDLAAVLQKAQQHPLLILDEGKPQAYLVSVDTFDTWMEVLVEMEEAEFATNIALGEEHTRLGFAFGKEGNCFDKLGFAKELKTSTIGIGVARVLLWNGVKVRILDEVINRFLVVTINHEQAKRVRDLIFFLKFS